MGRKMTWSDADAREALSRYEGLVRSTARRLRPLATVGQALDVDDLVAEGRVAVLEALSTYERYGIEEATWVRTRVRQRMIDAIRRLDLRSRAEMRLAARHSAGETEADEYEKGRQLAVRRLVSMDNAQADGEPMVARLADYRTSGVDQMAHRSRQHSRMVEALGILPPRQREALELGLWKGMPLREIGARMGISESRVCQLQRRAVQHLNRAIAA